MRKTAFASLITAIALSAGAQTPASHQHWIGSWAAANYYPESFYRVPAADLTDATIRETVHLSAGGSTLRVHFSNAYNPQPLHIAAAHIALPEAPGSSKIQPGTDHALTFDGAPDVTIPPGAEYDSDPIRFNAAPLSELAITFYLPQAPAQQTGHPGSRTTTYLTHGNQVSAPDLPGAKTIPHWLNIAGVDVTAPPQAYTILALGDSITDGDHSSVNGNTRWPDFLAQRLAASPKNATLGVLDEGIDGNHLLTDGLGPNALARFDRDVLGHPSVRYVVLLEGVNDIGALSRLPEPPSPAVHQQLVHNLIAAYQQIIDRAHAAGLTIYGATILPYMGSTYYHPGPSNEADRQALNAWIRQPGHFDGVIDFDHALADPHDPTRLNPAYDSGDHLHPSPAGYQAMANAIPLSLFSH